MKIAMLTSGGDSPGMNAAIRAAAMFGLARGAEIMGIQHGYRGLLDGEIHPLGAADVSGIMREGGTILGSARAPEFQRKEVRDVARRRLAEAGADGLIVIGGNGSLTGAAALADPAESPDPPRVVGVPASIDNDVGLTGYAIGVDTAINTIVEACDKISDTASAHDRAFIVEVMGRDCGYLAMASGIASAADAVLFRESNKSEDEIVRAVVGVIEKAQARKGRTRRVLIIKAEGLGIPTDRLKVRVEEALAGSRIETRVTVLGHVVRGGRPSGFDRLLASRLAHVAARALLAGDTRKMAAWWIGPDPAPEIGVRSPADPHCALVNIDAVLAETRCLLDGTSPVTRWRAKVFDEIADVLAL